MMTSCTLLLDSNSHHLQQLFTGLELLAKSKKILFKQVIDSRSELFKKNASLPNSLHSSGIRLIVNNRINLYVDVSDSHEVNKDILVWADVYLKRSFNSDIHRHISNKIKPLDLNYMVKPNFRSWRCVKRSLRLSSGTEKFKSVIRELDIKNRVSYLPRQREMEQAPQLDLPFRVLFLCRLWEPTKDVYYQLSKQQIADRENINEIRVGCIRALKKEFGELFTGGISDSVYARKYFKNEIFAEPLLTSKKNYIQLIRKFPVCVATTGLSKSIGWKFAEYLAQSKAIISEPLHSQTSGNIESGKHFLAFKTPGECVEQAVLLKQNTDFRNKMMQENHDYYKNYVAPEAYAKNILNTALEHPHHGA